MCRLPSLVALRRLPLLGALWLAVLTNLPGQPMAENPSLLPPPPPPRECEESVITLTLENSLGTHMNAPAQANLRAAVRLEPMRFRPTADKTVFTAEARLVHHGFEQDPTHYSPAPGVSIDTVPGDYVLRPGFATARLKVDYQPGLPEPTLTLWFNPGIDAEPPRESWVIRITERTPRGLVQREHHAGPFHVWLNNFQLAHRRELTNTTFEGFGSAFVFDDAAFAKSTAGAADIAEFTARRNAAVPAFPGGQIDSRTTLRLSVQCPPEVLRAEKRLHEIFLQGVPVADTLSASLNWKGRPGTATWRVNGGAAQPMNVNGTTAEARLDLGGAPFRLGDNSIAVGATRAGLESCLATVTSTLAPVPAWAGPATAFQAVTQGDIVAYTRAQPIEWKTPGRTTRITSVPFLVNGEIGVRDLAVTFSPEATSDGAEQSSSKLARLTGTVMFAGEPLELHAEETSTSTRIDRNAGLVSRGEFDVSWGTDTERTFGVLGLSVSYHLAFIGSGKARFKAGAQAPSWESDTWTGTITGGVEPKSIPLPVLGGTIGVTVGASIEDGRFSFDPGTNTVHTIGALRLRLGFSLAGFNVADTDVASLWTWNN